MHYAFLTIYNYLEEKPNVYLLTFAIFKFKMDIKFNATKR